MKPFNEAVLHGLARGHVLFVGRRKVELPLATKMSEFDTGALRYVFPEELLRYFDIVESGIHTDKPTG